MYCEQCGFKVEDDDKFCPQCGSRVDALEEEDEQIYTKKHRSRAWIWILVILFLVVAAVGILLFFFLNKNDATDDIPAQSDQSLSENEDLLNDVYKETTAEPENADDQGKYNIEDEKSNINNDDIEIEEKKETAAITDENAAEHILPFDVLASSVLQETGYNYDPSNLLDFDSSTCWCEGVEGNGVGESITFTSNGESQSVRGIAIVPGFNKSLDLYEKNAAPQTILLEYSALGMADDMLKISIDNYSYGDGTLYFDFDELVDISECKVTILEVRDGSKYDDCCISEMFLYN